MVIENRKQLIQNINTVESYLNDSASEEEYKTMANYIRRGRVFISYIVGGKYHFAPSRFLGYKNNTLEKHANNLEKDGTITTPAITKILHSKNECNEKLQKAYEEYCQWLGVEASQYKKTFWLLDGDVLPDLETQAFYEGAYKLRTHIQRERNRKVVVLAKKLFKSNHGGMLYCEACGINFNEKYGLTNDSMIEAHHKVEFSKGTGEQKIEPKDFVMLCPNCHKMIHTLDITISKLRKIIK